MKILLINPPSPFLLDDFVFPPLGLLQVAAALEEAGHAVQVCDLAGQSDVCQALAEKAGYDWDVFGITATTPQFPTAIELLRHLRLMVPGKRVLIGGPHATVQPSSCEGLFDCVVMGDGEDAILTAIEDGAPSKIDEATNTKKGELKWRWPARHLINMADYKYRLAGKLGTSAVWSMGCPYACNYCCGRLVPYYRRVRSREPKNVAAEMSLLADKYGIGAVMAFDDEVNLLNEPLLELCKAVESVGLKYRAFIKANLFTDYQAEAMAKAGFVQVCTGVESGSDRVLGIMQKQTSFAINLRAREIARKHGLQFKGFCSLGHVGETYDDVMETKRWILEAKPDDFDVTVITVYPGTPIYDYRQYVGELDGKRVCKYVHKSKRPEEDGATVFFEEVDYAKEWCYYKGRPHAYTSHVWTPGLGKADLVRLRDEIEDDCRKALGIPYPARYSGDWLDANPDAKSIAVQANYEHSYGAGLSPQDSRTARKEPSAAPLNVIL